MSAFQLQAQPTPLAAWDFQGNDWTRSQVGAFQLRGADRGYERVGTGNDAYIRLALNTHEGMMYLVPQLPETFSLVCWFRIPRAYRASKSRLFWTGDNGLQVTLGPEGLSVLSMVQDDKAKVPSRHLLWAMFTGVGIESYRYWSDGDWHQLVVQYHPRTGQKGIWLDGQQADSWKTVVPEKGRFCGNNNPDCKTDLRFSASTERDFHFGGELRGLEVYASYLSGSDIAQLYRRRSSSARNIPAQSSPQSGLDRKEFPKSPAFVNAVDQLQSFPLPRYQPGHELLPLFNWINPVYMAGYRLHTDRLDQAVETYKLLQTEMVTHWHYYLTLENSRRAMDLKQISGPSFTQAYIDLANQHPEWPLAINTFWAQLNGSDFGKSQGANISSRTLSPGWYLQDANGRFLERRGEISQNPAQWRPTAPDQLWKSDGAVQREYMDLVLAKLNRPVDIVNENGEVPPWPITAEVFTQDPVVTADKARSPHQDWERYASAWKTRLRSTYRDEFMSHPKLRNANFSWYAIDGGPYRLDRFHWDIARTAMRPINGQYYSTPNFYVRWPDNWEKWKGPWRGWDWINISRKVEIEAGDKLFSPFIAAGWDKNPEENVRPSQWLGLLKCLGVVGAEFYYVGVFHERQIAQFPLPENYTWQAAMPAYAQAVTSRYEEILRKGDLLVDVEGQAITRVPAQDPNILFTIRKHASKPEYILAGTLQPRSNVKGNVEDEATAYVTIENREMKVNVRRQGSVYWLNLRNPSSPVLVQLDAWHEAGHPSWWTENFSFQAENADFVQDCDIKTDPITNLDFTQFSSYLVSQSARSCSKYHFQPRTRSSYRLRVTAKGEGVSGSVSVMLDGKKIGQIPVRPSANWQVHTLESPLLRDLAPNESRVLSFDFSRSGLLLDEFLLEKTR